MGLLIFKGEELEERGEEALTLGGDGRGAGEDFEGELDTDFYIIMTRSVRKRGVEMEK